LFLIERENIHIQQKGGIKPKRSPL